MKQQKGERTSGKVVRATSAIKHHGRTAVRKVEARRKMAARRDSRPTLMMTTKEVRELVDAEARRHLQMSGAEFRAAVKRGDELPETPSVAQLRMITGVTGARKPNAAIDRHREHIQRSLGVLTNSRRVMKRHRACDQQDQPGAIAERSGQGVTSTLWGLRTSG